MADSKRDLRAWEQRRRRAGDLFAKGKSQAEVARRLGVSRVSAMRWHQSWVEAGLRGLASTGPPGRPSRMTDSQWRSVERVLQRGPERAGYSTDVWTLERIATVIRDVTGVEYHIGHVWRLLRQRGWSLQRPTARARERDEEAILRWKKQTWPREKKTSVRAERSSSSMKRASRKAQ